MNIGEQLKFYIRKSRITQAELARQTGIQESAISRFLTGERGLDLVSIEKLAKYFRLELRKKVR
ncbi:MAG TPA: helix-turn-helix transcriptional regulator [Phycisphaerae bacterium]|nr:helix-turn-helix transcriptional regulator [Phycisphaerae bacterium]